MANETINLKITDGTRSYGSFDVQKPKNYTNNDAFIGQHPLTGPETGANDSSIANWTTNNAGQLMSCFEINWGGAKAGWTNNPSEWNANYSYPTDIQTSSDLLRYIFMLRYEIYKLQHPDAPKVITVSPSSKTINHGALATFTASGTGGADAASTQWTITSGSSYASLSANSGASVSITGNNPQSTPTTAGSANISPVDPINYNGTTSIKCNAVAASVTASTKTVKLGFTNTTATEFVPSSKEITVTVTGQTSTSAVQSYAWSVTSNADYISPLTNTSGATVTVHGNNTTNSNKVVTLQCIVTWDNNATQTLTTTLTVNAQSVTYYWYVGQTQQSNLTSNPTTVSDNISEGWRTITEAVDQYTAASPLFNSSTNIIAFTGKAATEPSYVYLPKSYVDAGLAMYDDDGDEVTLYQYTNTTITVNGVIYNEYERSFRHTGFSGILIYKK